MNLIYGKYHVRDLPTVADAVLSVPLPGLETMKKVIVGYFSETSLEGSTSTQPYCLTKCR